MTDPKCVIEAKMCEVVQMPECDIYAAVYRSGNDWRIHAYPYRSIEHAREWMKDKMFAAGSFIAHITRASDSPAPAQAEGGKCPDCDGSGYVGGGCNFETGEGDIGQPCPSNCQGQATPAPPVPGKMTQEEYRKERERLIKAKKAECEKCTAAFCAWNSPYWANEAEFNPDIHNSKCMRIGRNIAALDSRYQQSIAEKPDNSPQGEGDFRFACCGRRCGSAPQHIPEPDAICSSCHGSGDRAVLVQNAFAAGRAAERADAAKLDTKSTAYMSGYEAGIAARDREIEGKVGATIREANRRCGTMSYFEFARELLKKESSRG